MDLLVVPHSIDASVLGSVWSRRSNTINGLCSMAFSPNVFSWLVSYFGLLLYKLNDALLDEQEDATLLYI